MQFSNIERKILDGFDSQTVWEEGRRDVGIKKYNRDVGIRKYNNGLKERF